MRYQANKGTSRPRVAGFYWARCMGTMSGREYETIVKICSSGLFSGSPANKIPDTVLWEGVSVSITDERLLAFAGPIPRPEGP